LLGNLEPQGVAIAASEDASILAYASRDKSTLTLSAVHFSLGLTSPTISASIPIDIPAGNDFTIKILPIPMAQSGGSLFPFVVLTMSKRMVVAYTFSASSSVNITSQPIATGDNTTTFAARNKADFSGFYLALAGPMNGTVATGLYEVPYSKNGQNVSIDGPVLTKAVAPYSSTPGADDDLFEVAIHPNTSTYCFVLGLSTSGMFPVPWRLHCRFDTGNEKSVVSLGANSNVEEHSIEFTASGTLCFSLVYSVAGSIFWYSRCFIPTATDPTILINITNSQNVNYVFGRMPVFSASGFGTNVSCLAQAMPSTSTSFAYFAGCDNKISNTSFDSIYGNSPFPAAAMSTISRDGSLYDNLLL